MRAGLQIVHTAIVCTQMEGADIVSKYEPLEKHLRGLDRSLEHSLSFADIERILGFHLPLSAHKYQAWWANQRNGRHVQANAWLDAGWHTQDLNLKAGQVTFHAVHLPRAPKALGRRTEQLRPLTIAQAKKAVALRFGVRPDDVEITVRG